MRESTNFYQTVYTSVITIIGLKFFSRAPALRTTWPNTFCSVQYRNNKSVKTACEKACNKQFYVVYV